MNKRKMIENRRRRAKRKALTAEFRAEIVPPCLICGRQGGVPKSQFLYREYPLDECGQPQGAEQYRVCLKCKDLSNWEQLAEERIPKELQNRPLREEAI